MHAILKPLSFPQFRRLLSIQAFTLGVFCVGIVAMELVLGFSIIPARTVVEHHAIIASASITGLLSLGYASMMTSIINDRRIQLADRRMAQKKIDFADRRCGKDRRANQV